jgi:multidrug efflux pump subunit AcrB
MREAMSDALGRVRSRDVRVYALLAVAFRRYVQPLIVMIAIPFGIIGAVLGHICWASTSRSSASWA